MHVLIVCNFSMLYSIFKTRLNIEFSINPGCTFRNYISIGDISDRGPALHGSTGFSYVDYSHLYNVTYSLRTKECLMALSADYLCSNERVVYIPMVVSYLLKTPSVSCYL